MTRLGFVLAQVGDLVTYRSDRELNGLVLALGDLAPFAKVALIAAVLVLVTRVPRTRPVLLVGIAAGVLGLATNIAARGV